MSITLHSKHLTFISLALCILWACPAVTAHALSFEDLTYMTEEYYPYNYTEKLEIKGISVDMLHMTWEKLGVAPQPIDVMPWARAYEHVQRDPATVLFSMAKTEEREDMFKWAGPIRVVRFVLIAKKSKQISLATLDDLAGHCVGTLRDDITDILLEKYKKIAKIDAVAEMDQNINKLIDDRLDIVAYEERSWRKIVAKKGLSPDDFETIFVLKETPVFFAFHIQTPPALIAQFQKALECIKTGDTYQQLLDKYLK